MPIHFNEGLPRSGKSYSAVKDYILPALEKGRMVYAHIDGLNHEVIAAMVGVTVERCREQLISLSAEDLREIWTKVTNDSLVVVDEVQNYFPHGREKLRPEMMKFITEHGHLGLDILLMGQDMKDVHAVWRRRVTQKVFFLKMEGVGAAGRYQWKCYKATAPEKWQLVKQSPMLGDVYEPKYFPCYSSFDPATENTSGTFHDKRAVLWNSSMFKVWVPAALVAGCVGAWYISGVFSRNTDRNPFLAANAATLKNVERSNKVAVGPSAVHSAAVAPGAGSAAAAPVSRAVEPVKLVGDEVTRLLNSGGARLAAVMWNNKRSAGLVEIGGDSGRLFSFELLRSLGWTLNLEDGILYGVRGSESFTALALPGRHQITMADRITGANLVTNR